MSCTTTTPAALRVAPIEHPAALADLAECWRSLAGDVPFRSATWLTTWWGHYCTPARRLWVLTVRDETGAVVGLAPWYVERQALSGRVVRFLGDGEVCSDHLTVLARPELAPDVSACLADWLAHDARAEWDVLELCGSIAGDPGVTGLVEELAGHGTCGSCWSNESCWRVELPASWDEYLAGLSKSRRQRCRQIQRRFLSTGRLRCHVVRAREDIERGWSLLVELHQKRRHALGQAGCFSSPRFAAFHREVVEQLLAEQALRLFWVEVDGRPAAAEYSLAGGEGVYYYQGGIDPDLADLSPGWLAFVSSLSGAIAAGCRWFDFLRGDEAYKAMWRARPRPLVTWRLAAPRPAARMRNTAWQAGRALKALARRGYGAWQGRAVVEREE